MDEIKKYYNSTKKFLSKKQVQSVIVIALLLSILILGAYIRLQPLPNLIDSTTGDYTPLALDPYYFLRVSETLIANEGVLPAIDEMRYQALDSGWTTELLPHSTVWMYKIAKMMSPNVTLNSMNVLNPVMFFILGLIIFFILVWMVTKSKWVALIGTGILTVIPPYLYRTLAGFSDHESIGMFGFFLAILFFVWGMFYLEKKKLNLYSIIGIGLGAGLMTVLAIASWGGGAKFLFMILPLMFIIRWLTKEDKSLWNYILFYGSFIIGTMIFIPIFGYDLVNTVKTYMLNSAGILTLPVLMYAIIKAAITQIKDLPKIIKENSKIASLISVFVIGGIFYQIFIGNLFAMVGQLLGAIVNPFGTGRVGLTVAENKQPYLVELIGQVGKTVFYTFLAGCLIVGANLAKGIKDKKLKPLFVSSFAFFIFGILFSRISASSVLNGENFLSKALFFISFLAFAISTIYIYSKSDWKIETKWIIIVAWMIPMLLAIRSAIRIFFAIVPFIAFMVPLTIFEIWKWTKKSKDSMIKLIGLILVILLVLSVGAALFGYYKTVDVQAKYQTPSYNSDWQKAMGWVRNNTAEGSTFLHWWDYGYWVQTGGNRPTVTDGGHFNGYWDHLIGRYVLTTPFPETAKSFMKAHNVSYLLIDPTDIGKYSAYSSIGDDEEVSDRASGIATFVSNPKETQETRNETIRIYRGGRYLDGDVYYNDSEKEIFLPKGKAAIGAIIVTKSSNNYSQPIGVYILNGKQYDLPMRYLFLGDQLVDFGSGINATAYIYPNVYDSGAGQQFDITGAAMYLSEKTMNSLVVKLYLMNDPNNEYEELELVHEESQYPFKFNYQGFRGPIAIWKVNDMPDIIAREEFTYENGGYGELDDLQFVK